MEKIRYYTYLETLKKITGEAILFGRSSGSDSTKFRLIAERYGRIINLLNEKGYLDNSLFDPDEDSDPEGIYSNISLLMAYLREHRKYE
ncbi:MAG: hypothetical protein JXN63_07705 [Candidatus Delongbacteria bacterium]|nr:hypothetical protein [Candidatus Delongbacteria bacterium]